MIAQRRFPQLLPALGVAVVALAVALVAQAALASFVLLCLVLALTVLWPLG